MPNQRKHKSAGGLIGAAAFMLINILEQRSLSKSKLEYKFNWSELFIKAGVGYGVGFISAQLPDLLEPAECPGHRKFFHSTTSLGLLCILASKTHTSNLQPAEKALIKVACAGYISHLVLDAQTPFGLPII